MRPKDIWNTLTRMRSPRLSAPDISESKQPSSRDNSSVSRRLRQRPKSSDDVRRHEEVLGGQTSHRVSGSDFSSSVRSSEEQARAGGHDISSEAQRCDSGAQLEGDDKTTTSRLHSGERDSRAKPVEKAHANSSKDYHRRSIAKQKHLIALHEKHEKLRKSSEHVTKAYQDLQQRDKNHLDHITKLKQEVKLYQKDAQSLNDRHTKLKQEYKKAQETISSQKTDITNLTETILLAGNRYDTTTRDDDYFEAEFTKLMGDIQQWVFRNFRGGSDDVKPEYFSEEVQLALRATILDAEPKVMTKEIEAVVANLIAHKIFNKFPLGQEQVGGLSEGFRLIHHHLGGADREKRKWHAQTTDMIIDDSRYKDCFHRGVETVAKHLNDSLEIRATHGNKAHREQALFEIVENAAKLAEETHRQVSRFQLWGMDVGISYDPSFMEDVSGLLGDDEVKEKQEGIIVRKVLFPVVVRFGFDEAGQEFKDPVVIRKGTIVVVRSEDTEEGSLLD